MSISRVFAVQVNEILTSLNIELNKIKEDSDVYYLYSSDITSENGLFRSLVEIVEDDKSVNIIICSSISINKNIPAVLELVNRLNSKTRHGAFVYNPEDGSIISQHSIYLTNDMNTFENQLLHATYLRITLIDHYMPAFLAVSEGKDVLEVLDDMNHNIKDLEKTLKD